MNREILKLKNVNKTFFEEENFEVLNDVSLTAKDGEFVCILGPSGCGKTILLYLIAGFLTPTSGEITLNDKIITKPGTDRMMVFQDYILFPWKTVYENILFGLYHSNIDEDQKKEIVMNHLELVGLTKFKDWYIHKLSGGMQQKVSIARALVVNPEILLMDEPFSAIDSQYRKFLRQSLEKIWQQKKKTIIFVTHSITEALKLADKIYVMSARPAVVKEIVDINLPRPRDRSSREFINLAAELNNLVLKEFELMMSSQSTEKSLGELLKGNF
ncbi:MAG: ABC transporter ATP-binding protein [Candidatus Kerfeldbacteria bacterium]